jgi:hypothetical protein
MADMHLLTRVGERHRVACHIPIPNVNNGAGFNYRTALVNAGLATVSVMPAGDGTIGTISSAEVTSLAAGALVERIVLLDITQGGTLTTAGQINAFLDTFFIALTAEVQAELQFRLAQFGRIR